MAVQGEVLQGLGAGGGGWCCSLCAWPAGLHGWPFRSWGCSRAGDKQLLCGQVAQLSNGAGCGVAGPATLGGTSVHRQGVKEVVASHVHHPAGAQHCFLTFPAVGFPEHLNADTFPKDVAFFAASHLVLYPSSSLSVWEGSWQTPVPNPTGTSTAAGRGVRSGAGIAYAGALQKWGLYDCPAPWLGGMASRRGSSLDASSCYIRQQSPFPTKAVGDGGICPGSAKQQPGAEPGPPGHLQLLPAGQAPSYLKEGFPAR